MPPVGKARCCKSDHLSSYRGHRLLPQAATGRQGSGPRINPSSNATAQAALGNSRLQQPRQDAANLIICLRRPVTTYLLSQTSNSNDSIHQQLSKAQQLKAAKQPRQQSNSPSSPGGLRPPAAKAGCCKSDQLSSYRGHRYLPQAATGRPTSTGCCKSDQLSSYRGHSSVPQGISGCRPRAPPHPPWPSN